jgi:ubiquinone biosynthesis protein
MIHPLKTLRTYGRLKRYREIALVLLKYGFDDISFRILPEASVWRGLRFRRRKKRSNIPTPRRLRLALTDLGPTFVKLGQLLSTRPDILPDEYITELELLQDQVRPFPYDEVRQICLDEFEKQPEELLGSIDSTPLASASIAQVHRAVTKSGEVVAVKVQRPGIRTRIEADLVILDELTALMERRVPELSWFRPREILAQFANSIRRELDFVAEAQALERFRANFESDESRVIPRVHWELSSRRVLTTEFIDGVKVNDLEELDARGYDRKEIARNGARAVLKEVFEHRLFHADPHPGNVFVLDGNVIATVDFGIVGRLDEDTAEYLGGLLSAVVHRDAIAVARIFKRMELLPEDVDESLLKFDILEFVDRYHGLPLDRIDAEQLIQELLQTLRRHRIILPVNLAMVGRMLAITAGVGRKLDPEFDIVAEAKPFVQSFIVSRFDPRRKARNLVGSLQAYQSVLSALPEDLEEIVAKVKKGKMLVALHHEGLDHFTLEMDRSSNRLAFGMIIAALIIGSSFILQLDKGPMILGFSAVGLAGFLIAGLLGLWLVLAILRSGRI